MKKTDRALTAAGAVALAALLSGCADDGNAGAVLGGALGGGAGAAIGQQVGGRDGAIIGGAIGGATGAAMGSNRDAGRRGDEDDDGYRGRRHHDNGRYEGERGDSDEEDDD